MFMFDFNIEALSLWFASSSIILLITSELISPYYGKANIIDVKRLRIIAIAFAIASIIISIIRISVII